MEIKTHIKTTPFIVGAIAVALCFSAVAYAVSGVWTRTDSLTLAPLTGGDIYRSSVALSADGSTVAVGTAHWDNFDAEVHIYTDTDGDGDFSDNTDSRQVVRVLEGYTDGGDPTTADSGSINDLELNEDGTRLVVFLSAGANAGGTHIRTYDLIKPQATPPANTAPTITQVDYQTATNNPATTAKTGETIFTAIFFSEAVGTPTIKRSTGANIAGTAFTIITTGTLADGECKATGTNTTYVCRSTESNAGLYKVWVSAFADTEGLAGTPQTYATNSGGVSITVPVKTAWDQTILFAGNKASTQAITVAGAIADGTGLTTETATFGGTLIKTLKAGSMTVSVWLEMSEGNTHELYYKDGSAPTSATDGTKVGGGTPSWGSYNGSTGAKWYTTAQAWATQTSVPVNRYYWVRSSMDVLYHGASTYRVQYTY